MPIRRLFIANRGEIAVRIIRAAHELGISTIQAVSRADRNTLAAHLADEIVEIGPASAARSYLCAEAIIDGALAGGADAIHPGYGFLAENAEFAEAVEGAGLTFVGPDPATIRQMGNKASARAVAQALGVPTLPGSEGALGGLAEARALAASIGWPVMIKAVAGGGGRGIRIARNDAELAAQIPQAMQEATSSFGNADLYLERVVENARHIEVQVLGDGERVVHLFERECSLQRRRQKLWEEAPAACLPAATRAALCASAQRLAEYVAYRGAGTVEYLYDEAEGRFWFIEMNTRIQVEHPVSEMITGVDIVAEQLRVAGGAPLSFSQDDVCINGHAIECRINAEDPARDFAPSPGLVTCCELSGASWLRFDSQLYAGYEVPPYYDSLVGKLIAHGADRHEALARIAAALDALQIEGIRTTVPLHRRLAADPAVHAQRFHTQWLEQWLAANPMRGEHCRGEQA